DNARGDRDGLAPAKLHFLAGHHDRVAAELAHRHVERDAGARRRLVEDHGKRLADQRPLAATALRLLLERAAHLDHPPQLGGRDVDDVEEMANAVAAHPTAPSLRGLAWACATRVQARSIMPTASSSSASPMVNGGSSRTTLPP